MGKIRHKRHAYHTAAPKLENSEVSSQMETSTSEKTPTTMDSPFPKVSSNIFANVSIAPALLKQTLVAAAPTRREKRRAKEAQKRKENLSLQLEFKEMLLTNKKLKKKDRQPVNHVFKAAFKSVERKNELKRKVGVGHMDSLMNALPTEREVEKEEKPIKRKARISKSSKMQAKEMSEDMNLFLDIMKNPAFVSDPFAAISTHLKRKLEAERPNT